MRERQQQLIDSLDFESLLDLHNEAMNFTFLIAALNHQQLRASTDSYLLTNELIWGWKKPEDYDRNVTNLLVMRAIDTVPNIIQWLTVGKGLPSANQLIAMLRLSPSDQQAIIERMVGAEQRAKARQQPNSRTV